MELYSVEGLSLLCFCLLEWMVVRSSFGMEDIFCKIWDPGSLYLGTDTTKGKIIFLGNQRQISYVTFWGTIDMI